MHSTWRRFSQQFRSPIWTVPLALLGVCALSYGSMASRMGIYQDDWFITFFRHYLGPSSLVEAFAIDRPLLGWMHWATTGLVGESLLSWQLFGIFTRWLSCLALWWALRGLWTQKYPEVTAVVMLFAVYPGFQQQYIAITYSSGFIVLAAFLASLGSMLWALRRPRWFWFLYLGSIALDGFGMFTAEYFFGLELLRPLMLWLVLGEEKADLRKRLVRVFLYWIPYLFLMLIFLAWRVSTPTPRGTIDIFSKLSAGSFGAVLDLAKMVIQNVYMASLLAWSRVFSLGILRAYGPPAILKYALVVLGTGCLVFIVLVFLRVRREPEQDSLPEPRTGWSIMAFVLGLYALLAGGLPVWMTNLHMDLEYPWDRLTLPMMLGVSLLFGSLLLLIPRWRLLSYGSLAVAVGLAAGLHYQSALSYRQEWTLQQDFFWQLAWRAPSIQPGTVILTSELPFVYDYDSLLTAPLNWTYAAFLSGRELPYQLYNVESHLGLGLAGFEPDTPIRQSNRITPFEGSTSQAIVVFYRPPGCLKVIDPQYDRSLPDKPRYFRELLPLSRPELISAAGEPAARPPKQFFTAEPAPGWCYYFQKAELARQDGDWEKVAALGDQALQGERRIYRRNAAELAPYIEGYARIGRWEDAQALSIEAYQAWANTRLMLCDAWRLVKNSAEIDAQGKATLVNIQTKLNCGLP
jgi:hypothetical protein